MREAEETCLVGTGPVGAGTAAAVAVGAMMELREGERVMRKAWRLEIGTHPSSSLYTFGNQLELTIQTKLALRLLNDTLCCSRLTNAVDSRANKITHELDGESGVLLRQAHPAPTGFPCLAHTLSMHKARMRTLPCFLSS